MAWVLELALKPLCCFRDVREVRRRLKTRRIAFEAGAECGMAAPKTAASCVNGVLAAAIFGSGGHCTREVLATHLSPLLPRQPKYEQSGVNVIIISTMKDCVPRNT